MLSISKAIRGAGQVDYYLELAREDYYLEGGEPLGKWFGRGAKALGVEAWSTVEKADLRTLFRGKSPLDGQELVQNASDPKRRTGWDLTFSAPKSVSVLWSQAEPEVRQKIQAAQARGVEAALHYLQDVAGFTRRGAQGKEFEKAKLTFACFEHGTSRAQDPQLHTHALLLNIAVREDGTTATVTSEQLFAHKMAAGAIYRTELAAALVRELGVELEADRQFFAVKGVSKDLCDVFSKRSEEVEKALKEMGLEGAVAAKIAVLATRNVKQHVAREELFETWAKVGREHGWSEPEARAVLGKIEPTHNNEATAKLVVATALSRIMTEQNYFSEAKLVRTAAQDAQLLGLSGYNVLDAVSVLKETGQITEIGKHKGQAVFSTPARLAEEREILDFAYRDRNSSAHVVDLERAIPQVLAKKDHLSKEQQDAVLHITAEKGDLKVVSGMAGTGKTSMLKAAREIWEEEGFRVVGAALSGKAARGLEEGAGIKTATIARMERELAKGESILETRPKTVAPKASEWSPFYGLKVSVLALRHDPIKLDSKTILVVDEGSMVETHQMKNLLAEAKKAGAKVVLVGDERQLQAIGSGGAFKALGDAVGRVHLTDIKRQTQAWARDLVRLFADGKAEEALKKAKEHDLLFCAENKQRACEKLIDSWKHKGVSKPEENLILAGTREDTEHLNTLAQTERRKGGELSRFKSLTINETKFYVGDRVLLTQNSKALKVENGTLATVTGIDTKIKKSPMLEIVTDAGHKVRIPVKHYQNIELGYAVTTHKAQGMTTRDAYVLLTSVMQNRELSYVQASRASRFTRFFADRPEENLGELTKLMSQSQEKELASTIQKRHEQEQLRAALEREKREQELRRQQQRTLNISLK